MPQPHSDCGQMSKLLRIVQRSHCAAIRMTADNNRLHIQHRYRIFQGGRDASERVAVGGHDISDNLALEDIAGGAREDDARDHTRVRTRDKEDPWALGVCKLVEELLMFRKAFIAELVVAGEEKVAYRFWGVVGAHEE